MDGDLVMTEQEKDQLAFCKELGLPDDAELIDDVFYVWKTRFGLHSTMTKQGRKMLTGLKREDVINVANIVEDSLTQLLIHVCRILWFTIFIVDDTILSSVNPCSTMCIFTLLFDQFVDSLLKMPESVVHWTNSFDFFNIQEKSVFGDIMCH